MSTIRILLVHPDPTVLSLLRSMLQSLGQPLDEAESDRAALKHLERGQNDLVIAGVDPHDPDALEIVDYVRRKVPRIPIILLFTVPHPERAKEALQHGAAMVLRFPVAATQLRAAVAQVVGVAESVLMSQGPRGTSRTSTTPSPSPLGRANGNGNGLGHGASPAAFPLLGTTVPSHPAGGHAVSPTGAAAIPSAALPSHGMNFALDAALAQLHGVESPLARGDRPPIVGDDPSLRQAIELAETIAPTRAPVLILGEKGSGKALLAKALHQQSLRRDGPFVEATCAHLKEAALEVELFGRKASFSDPLGDRAGKVANAQGGTLYLDEVSALSPELQFKLLRLIQEGVYEPVGSTQTFRADVRVILGSKENLVAWVEQGRFRQDLFGRIAVVSLKLPPLRHRGADVDRLADHFRDRFARELGKEVVGFTPEAYAALRRHEWPGNVEELEHLVERAVLICRGPRIDADTIHRALTEAAPPRPTSSTPRPHVQARSIRPLKEALEEPEKRIILQALEALNWNRQETARMLDINRTTLYKKMKKYGLLFDEPAWMN